MNRVVGVPTVELIRVINKRRTSTGAVVWIKLPPRPYANVDRQAQPPRANLRPAAGVVNFNKTAAAVQGLNIINILPPPPRLLYINDPTALFRGLSTKRL